MKLVTMKELLDKAYMNGYAVPAINVSNLETINGLFEIAEKLKAPVILQVAPIQIELQKLTYDHLVEVIKSAAKRYTGEYAIHLDHGDDLVGLKESVEAGFTSVMFDGSKLDYDQNIESTAIARSLSENITLEGELGVMNAEASEDEGAQADNFTDSTQALDFVSKTSVDCLAVSIGNVHGFYKGQPKLNFEILEEINKKVQIPIVLHGASGLPEVDIKKAIELGVSKINFFTAIDHAYTKGILEALESNKEMFMMSYAENGRQEMMKEIEKVIRMCNADGKVDAHI